jgi:heme exporter protein C
MIIKKLFLFKNFDKNFAFFAPFSLVLGLVLLIIGAIKIYYSPIDYQQGNAVKIMYIHVPAAWMGLLVYTLMAAFNLSGFIYKNPFFHLISKSIAPIGAIFTLVTLITGSIWGKPIWGSWWVWDARLTSVLILFFLYMGYIILTHSFDDQEKSQKIAAIISIIGFINIPIIKFSVEYFNSLHQKASILRSGGVAIDSSMLKPLLTMFACYFCYFVFFSLIAVKTAIIDKKILKLAVDN